MATLRISLFGSMRIFRADWQAEVQLTRIVQAFFAYLLINRQRFHPREVLADLFWGDRPEEQARNCLNTTIWRLRRILLLESIPKGYYLVSTPSGEVGFNRQCDFWLDAAVFEKQVNSILKENFADIDSEKIYQLESTLDLYKGELLDGLYYDWALRERERLRLLYLNALEQLMRYYGGCGTYDKAIACGQKILSQDPLREEIHREVMRFYLETGQRNQAMCHYKDCCQILKQELGISPLEETQQLYKEVAKMTQVRPTDVNFGEFQELSNCKKTASLLQVLNKLNLVAADFDKMNEKISEIVRSLERAIKI